VWQSVEVLFDKPASLLLVLSTFVILRRAVIVQTFGQQNVVNKQILLLLFGRSFLLPEGTGIVLAFYYLLLVLCQRQSLDQRVTAAAVIDVLLRLYGTV